MKSILKKIGQVPFPSFTGERVYMFPFFQKDGLPSHLSRWEPTIKTMLKDVITNKPIYLMIDQGEVQAGKTHRRPRPHIDGNWIADVNCHSGGTHLPVPSPAPTWRTNGYWSLAGKHDTHRSDIAGLFPEAIILASNVGSCRAWIGDINGEPGEGGDCSHIDLSNNNFVDFEASTAYMGNVTMIHESLPVTQSCQRTVVRLNLPGVEF